jgi:hypothetical protein
MLYRQVVVGNKKVKQEVMSKITEVISEFPGFSATELLGKRGLYLKYVVWVITL